MSRFELTINPEYVPNWTVQDGLRELLQNALDESIINDSNSMNVERKGNTLFISTKNAVLSKKTLLIGTTSKKENDETIGSKGEGYKLACLVLTREGHKVIIHNYSEKEKWIPKIINSRRYKNKLLVVDTEKFRWSSPPNHDLTFEISGITDDIYSEMTNRALFLRDKKPKVFLDKEIGEVLLDKEEAGKVYVNGLYVNTIKDSIVYGYNLKPYRIGLDRDRKTVTDFNLTWETSNLWSRFNNTKEFKDLIINGSADVQYINNHYFDDASNIMEDFIEENGEKAFPVSNQDELVEAENMYTDINLVIVNKTHCDLLKSSSLFTDKKESFMLVEKEKIPKELLEEFKESYSFLFNKEAIEALDNLIKLSEKWSIR